MRTDLRLAVRFLRHAEHRDRVRGVLMVAGVTLTVFCALVVLAVPQALDAADRRNAARVPRRQAGTQGMQYNASAELVDGRAWTRVTLTQVQAGAPTPPGVPAWPATGESLVSPALARALADRRDGPSLLADVVPARIGDAGLTGPDELVSYTVAMGAGAADSVVIGFGDPQARGQTLSALIVGELFLLVGVPIAVFLSVLLRLSYRSRQRRMAALRVLGVTPRRCARMFAWEMMVTTALGVAAGALAFATLEGVLGQSGLLGIRWFPGDGQMSFPALTVLVVVATVATGGMARAVMRRSVDVPWGTRPLSFVRGLLGGLLFAVALTVIAVVVARDAGLPAGSRALPEDAYVPTVLGCALVGLIGVLLVLPSLIAGIARASERHLPSVGLRLGARYAQHHAVTLSRVVSGIAIMIFLAGAGAAIMHGTYLDGVGDLSRVTVSVATTDLDATSRQRLVEIAAPARQLTIEAARTGQPLDSNSLVGSADNVRPWIIVAACQDLQRMAQRPHEGTPCTGEPQRANPLAGFVGQAPPDLVPGEALRVARAGLPPVTITVPRSPLTIDVSSPSGLALLLAPRDAPWAALARDLTITFQASAVDGSYERLLAAIHAAAPAASPNSLFKDPYALAAYAQQSAILGAAITCGFLLILACFSLSLLDLRWHNTPVLAAQRAIGSPQRVIAQSTVTQAVLPVVAALLVVAPLTLLLGWAFTGYWGSEHLFSWAVTVPVTLLTVVGVSASALSGRVLGHGRFELADLRVE